jgi:hypothetical protein
MAMDTVRAISALLRDLPPAGVTGEARAAWFDRKADLFDRIAVEDASLREQATDFAGNARAEAVRLRAGGA